MTRDEILAALESEQGVPARFIYLLDVIPLVEMLWADGRNQEAEIGLVKKFLLEHVADLDNAVEAEAPVGAADINDFLDRFVYRRPDPGVLERLKELAHWNVANTHEAVSRSETVLDYCLDIASAAVTHYPHGYHERFVEAEKHALKDLIANLQLDPNRAPA
jgi:hypothetical protein